MRKFTIPQATLDEQFAASDPKRSAWVSANAGSGKTHVLTQRVIRLMLEGNAPDKILCLTFTKAAAANMKNRVFKTLSGWTMLEDGELREEIHGATGSRPDDSTLRNARALFTHALDTPGGLKIQTIHAFCESLLHQFPLEANLSGHFEVLQDSQQAVLLDNARSFVFENDRDGQVAQAYLQLTRSVSDSALNDAISETIAKRSDVQRWMMESGGTFSGAVSTLYAALGLAETDTKESLLAEFFRRIEGEKGFFQSVSLLARKSGKPKDIKLAGNLESWLAGEETTEAFENLRTGLFTKEMTISAERSMATKPVREAVPDFVGRFIGLAETCLSTFDKLKSLQLVAMNRSLLFVSDRIIKRYEILKRRNGLVDYDDQIWKTVDLLHRNDIRDWIRYRLDRGIDHVLVDEAQDTSPAQWKIINAITEDFYSGQGMSDIRRTMFVVGDEKQSIYSFQGADPKEFARQQDNLEQRSSHVGQNLKNARLALSFRSTQDVLHAVDRVFEIPENLLGLTQDGFAPVHDAVRANDPGEVQVWPLHVREKTGKKMRWLDPLDKLDEDDPAVRLADQIGKAVGQWVGKPLPGTGKILKYGDILVLVRHRDRFITALTRKLKDMGHQVAGADRLRLLEHIAVEDLLAVGRFVILPDDDLNLACLLKSVFLGVPEDMLFMLARGRGSASLWANIQSIAVEPDHTAFEAAQRLVGRLEAFRSFGRHNDLFEFYGWLLGAQEGRRQILKRLGSEAEDVIDAFMDEIVDFTNAGGIGLEAFIARFDRANPEIKREMELDRDEIRILTVHAAKGLEARIVFLVDACGKPFDEKKRPKLLKLTNGTGPSPIVWVPTKDFHVAASTEQTRNLAAAAQAEYRRLLYVGMTRAADRLIVCGYRGPREPGFLHWHSMVHDALLPGSEPVLDCNHEPSGFRWISEAKEPVPEKIGEQTKTREAITREQLPSWLLETVEPEPVLSRPLTPSGAYALIDEQTKDARRPAFERSDATLSKRPLDYGLVVHRLLEYLPGVQPDQRAAIATKYLEKSSPDWDPEFGEAAIQGVLTLLEDERFSILFSSQSRAEVPVAGRLETRSGLRLISGQIDRLTVEENRVMIVDYKTNRIVPKSPETVSQEYVTQLALYRYLLKDVFADRPIECYLVWTETQTVMRLPEEELDAMIERLKKA